MTIIITPGETTLIQELIKLDIPYKSQNLLIGDIHIQTANGETVYIIERKARGDLDASIKDGRYKEQKARLIETGISRHCVIYLVENLKTPNDDPGKQRVWSAISNTFNRDGFSVFQTQSTHQSAIFLNALRKSVEQHESYFAKLNAAPDVQTSDSQSQSQSQPVNVNIKKKQVSKELWFTYSLTLIPRCSIGIAKIITDKFPTISALKDEIDNSGVNCLSELRYGESKKRIGVKLSNEICNIILQQFTN